MDDLTTPSQTVGPFFAVMLADETIGARIVEPASTGAVRLEGSVVDGEGVPVPDALLELWQADVEGRYPHPSDTRADLAPVPAFTGFARCATDEEGRFAFVVVKPGRVPFDSTRTQAPHIDVSVFARGLLKRLVTRIYFPDEQEANAVDPVLSSLPPGARQTLIARQDGAVLRFDIRLQGAGQTAFFAL